MNNINKVIPLTMALTIFPSANAALSTYADKASFLAATSSVTTEDFSGEADGVFDSRSFKDFNAILVNKSFGNTGVNQPEIYNETLRIQIWDSNSELQLEFNQSIRALGFDWSNTDGSNDLMELLVDGESFAFGPAQNSGFFGVISDSALIGLALSDTEGDGGACEYCTIDNLSYSAVPVPAAAWLFGSALAGLSVVRRKK